MFPKLVKLASVVIHIPAIMDYPKVFTFVEFSMKDVRCKIELIIIVPITTYLLKDPLRNITVEKMSCMRLTFLTEDHMLSGVR